MKKWANVFFVLLILMQSCRVYNVKPVPIDDAVSSGKRVKIHTNDGKRIKFKKIVIDSHQYYGIKKRGGKVTKILLDVHSIEKVRLHNQTKSIIFGIITGVAISLVVGVVIALSSFNLSLGGPIAGPW